MSVLPRDLLNLLQEYSISPNNIRLINKHYATLKPVKLRKKVDELIDKINLIENNDNYPFTTSNRKNYLNYIMKYSIINFIYINT